MTAELWWKPLWYCADCGEGGDMETDDEETVAAEVAAHNRLYHAVEE